MFQIKYDLIRKKVTMAIVIIANAALSYITKNFTQSHLMVTLKRVIRESY